MSTTIASGALFSAILLLFLHLGCFTLFSTKAKPRKKIISISPSTSFNSNTKPEQQPQPQRSSLVARSIPSFLNHFLTIIYFNKKNKPHLDPLTPAAPLPLSPHLQLSNDHEEYSLPSFSTRSDNVINIFGVCTICGEVLATPQHLEHHVATDHSLSQLHDGDTGKKIAEIIFHSGWKGKSRPIIHRILKIHNNPNILARFEEYREMVRMRSAARSTGGIDERCIADGNERLRFYCSTVVCDFMSTSSSRVRVCGSQLCSTCGIVRNGFGFMGKQQAVDMELDGMATHVSSWGAHMALPGELEEEFAFMHVRRAMLVCRVVAGRVARGGGEEGGRRKKRVPFDSVMMKRGGRGGGGGEEEEELLVFNPWAVLPCFVILYSVIDT